jgi:hypothetical protein
LNLALWVSCHPYFRRGLCRVAPGRVALCTGARVPKRQLSSWPSCTMRRFPARPGKEGRRPPQADPLRKWPPLS